MLYYSYGDMARVAHMIKNGNTNSSDGYGGGNNSAANKDPKHVKIEMQRLYAMVDYCENDADCRRALALKYFGENFDRSNCNGTCDNCSRTMGDPLQNEDMTAAAKQLVQIVEALGGSAGGGSGWSGGSGYRGNSNATPGSDAKPQSIIAIARGTAVRAGGKSKQNQRDYSTIPCYGALKHYTINDLQVCVFCMPMWD
jgi:hypothetical protein